MPVRVYVRAAPSCLGICSELAEEEGEEGTEGEERGEGRGGKGIVLMTDRNRAKSGMERLSCENKSTS